MLLYLYNYLILFLILLFLHLLILYLVVIVHHIIFIILYYLLVLLHLFILLPMLIFQIGYHYHLIHIPIDHFYLIITIPSHDVRERKQMNYLLLKDFNLLYHLWLGQLLIFMIKTNYLTFIRLNMLKNDQNQNNRYLFDMNFLRNLLYLTLMEFVKN